MEPITLLRFDERWLDAVSQLVTDPDVLRFTRIPEPVPEDFARAWLNRYEGGRRDGTREAFVAVSSAGEFLGLALALAIDRQAAELELGYVVAPAARGQGVATAMLTCLTEWAFSEVGARRITLIIDVENAGSQRVAQRCGYTREGVMRSIYLKPGRRVDAELWSRLETDPG
jgi:RimJ/RimL family protein N-acetyltransferase